MKILLINAISTTSSTGRICKELADYLNDSGHKAYIAYSMGAHPKNGYKISTKVGIKLHGLLSRIFGTQAYFSRISTWRLIKHIKIISPNIVHLHNLHSNYINLKMLLKYLANNDIPTVLTLHDCWFYTGKCTHYTISDCYKWKKECYTCPRIHMDNRSWFFDRTKKMHRDKKKWFEEIPRLAVIGVSDWITNEAKQSIISSAKIIKRIYNWIDLDKFKPVKAEKIKAYLGLQNKFIILGVASGWNERKGFNKYIKLAEMLPDDMAIVLVGKIKSKESLPTNILHIDVTHNVSELVEYYSMADVYMNFSAEETFGKVTAEGLACGTPAIAVNSTANPEIIGEGCGFVVDEIKFEKLFGCILEIKNKDKSTYQDNCIKYANENFKMKKLLSEHVDLYKQLINYD